MKKLFVILCLLPLAVFSQEKQQATKYGINFSGFVKSDFFWDSRQSVTIREGHFLLYPAAISEDADKNDINAVPNFNFLAIQSRLTGKITGPDAFKAKTSGLIEADFFGNETPGVFADVNGFRLRHAFVKLNWTKTELLMGQYWHPLFVTNSFPSVISFNTGAPIQPFSRNSQIRITQKINNISIFVAACSQRDFISPISSNLLRNSAIPEVQLQMQYTKKDDSTKSEFSIGVGGGYKTIVPRINSEISTTIAETYSIDTTTWVISKTPAKTTLKKYAVDEKVGGYSVMAFLKYKIPDITFKLYGVYGQNLYDLTMLGGFGIDTITNAAIDERSYSPYNTLAAWTEIHTNGEKIQFGLFAGYTKNLGASNYISNNSILFAETKKYCRGWDIDFVYRIAPRIVLIRDKFQFATEIEYTTASYATLNAGIYNINHKGAITESKQISNIRLLFASIYNF